MSNIHVIDHPLVAHLLGEARSEQTGPQRFREVVSRIGVMLAYEATRDLPTTPTEVRTPIETTTARRLGVPVTIVPILRAGLGLAQGIMDLLPEAQIGHVGLFRDEASLKPVSYYHKLPREVSDSVALLVDPMLATGGSAVKGVELLRNMGCRDVRMICLLAAPEGLTHLHAHHPDVPVFTAAVDRQLNESGFILPGLGDAGDRLFGTTR